MVLQGNGADPQSSETAGPGDPVCVCVCVCVYVRRYMDCVTYIMHAFLCILR